MADWIIKAQFSKLYNVIVLVVSLAILAAIGALIWYWSRPAGIVTPHRLAVGEAVLNMRHEMFALMGLLPLFLALMVTHIVDLVAPRTILTISQDGLHDARVTRGPIPWRTIKSLTHYRKGWQTVAIIDLESADVRPNGDWLRFGSMPIFAFNRWCARRLKHPELVIGLGGLTHDAELLMYAIGAHMQTHQTSR